MKKWKFRTKPKKKWEWALAHAKNSTTEKLFNLFKRRKRIPKYIQFQKYVYFLSLLTTTDHTSIQDDQWYNFIYRWPHLFPHEERKRFERVQECKICHLFIQTKPARGSWKWTKKVVEINCSKYFQVRRTRK